MVKFNGISLTDVAPVEILNITVSKPELIITRIEKPTGNGSRFVRRQYGPRYVTVEFVLPVEDAEERADYMNAIMEWADGEEPAALKLQKHAGYLMANLYEASEKTDRDWAEPLSIVFECGNPEYNADNEDAVDCGVSFQVQKNIAPAWRIEAVYASTQTSPSWTMDGATIALSGSIAAGTLIIDGETKSITLDGESVMDQLTIASRFFEDADGKSLLTKGAHEITGGGAFYWRERWI